MEKNCIIEFLSKRGKERKKEKGWTKPENRRIENKWREGKEKAREREEKYRKRDRKEKNDEKREKKSDRKRRNGYRNCAFLLF